MLKAKPGIVYAELLAEKDGDAYTYMIESEVGVDIRKSLFYTLAEKKWALIGLEAVGMSLEDIFITIVDQTSTKNRYERRATKGRKANVGSRIEADITKNIVEKNENNSSEFSGLFDEDDKNEK